ncbi:MAG TPA: tetraacyldisaccharide 4'-kinase [Gammaproteobacteria bacterium]|nr:tetraacyldisaccharide 4'-kinase [Gammaproteobacteria bacterium]
MSDPGHVDDAVNGAARERDAAGAAAHADSGAAETAGRNARRDRRAAATGFLSSLWYAPSGRHPLAVRLLRPMAVLYRGAVSLRAAAYSIGLKRAVELPVPVVVVGNISVGGTGKTPFLIWLAARLAERGYACGVVTRGYGGASPVWPRTVTAESDPREVGDEPVLLARRTGCAVAAGPDRVRAAQHLLSSAAVDVLLSDDGLQHYRLARTVEIAVVDGTRGLGNGLCLPAGPLREPPERLREVDAVVINGGAWGGEGSFRGELAVTQVYRVGDDRTQTADGADYRAAEKPGLARDGRRPAALEDFAGRSVHAVAGIGHPERFFEMLERAGLRVVPHPLPDHAEIAAGDLELGPEPVLLTEKDAVKCRFTPRGEVWCVAVEMRFERTAADELIARIVRRLPEPAKHPRLP